MWRFALSLRTRFNTFWIIFFIKWDWVSFCHGTIVRVFYSGNCLSFHKLASDPILWKSQHFLLRNLLLLVHLAGSCSPFHVSAQASPPLGSPPCLHPVLGSFSPLCLSLWHTSHRPSHFDPGLTLWLSPGDVAPGDKALSFCPPAQSRAQHTIENSCLGTSGLSDGEEVLRDFWYPEKSHSLARLRLALCLPQGVVFDSLSHILLSLAFKTLFHLNYHAYFSCILYSNQAIFLTITWTRYIFAFLQVFAYVVPFHRKSILFSDGKPFFKDFWSLEYIYIYRKVTKIVPSIAIYPSFSFS